MTTLHLNASQLPIDGDPAATTWRVEMNDNFLDFTLSNGKMTVEMNTYVFPDEDIPGLEPEYTTARIDLRTAAFMAARHIRGDFYNPNTNKFVGLFVAKS